MKKNLLIPALIYDFKYFFSALLEQDLKNLNKIYHDEVLFEDPFHSLRGLEELKSYFRKLNSNLNSISFEFEEPIINDGKTAIGWKMRARLIRPSKDIEVEGISLISYDDKIYAQKDFFDAGSLVYEHLPILGWMIRIVKKRLS